MKQQLASQEGVLFAIPAIIWGSTWYAITFQLGTVDPLYSVSYRFVLAGVLLIAYCLMRKIPLRFTPQQHARILQQALFLFGINYWLTYVSEQYITSALVAILFSLIIFMNVIFGRIFLNNPIRKQVVFGAILGLTGTILIFQPELAKYEGGDQTLLGLGLCTLGVVSASLGNITSAYNQRHQLPVLSTNALGMLYGGLSMFLIALLTGRSLSFEFTIPYITSLIYLAVFGSIIAFGAYLTLIGKIGPDKAAYALVIVPLIAIFVSVVMEGYQLRLISGFGIILLILGNVVALRKV
ncbi:MAG: EamA family transporter [Bacteroidota bacterium]